MEALSDLRFKNESAFIPTSVIVDFGFPGSSARSFEIADASATTAKSVVASVTGVPNVTLLDELELEPMSCHGLVLTDGTVSLNVSANQPGGVIAGKRTINYFLG